MSEAQFHGNCGIIKTSSQTHRLTQICISAVWGMCCGRCPVSWSQNLEKIGQMKKGTETPVLPHLVALLTDWQKPERGDYRDCVRTGVCGYGSYRWCYKENLVLLGDNNSLENRAGTKE